MDPATIALAITAARTAVGAAKGIQSIGHSLEGVFKASEEHKKKKAKRLRGNKYVKLRGVGVFG